MMIQTGGYDFTAEIIQQDESCIVRSYLDIMMSVNSMAMKELAILHMCLNKGIILKYHAFVKENPSFGMKKKTQTNQTFLSLIQGRGFHGFHRTPCLDLTGFNRYIYSSHIFVFELLQRNKLFPQQREEFFTS